MTEKNIKAGILHSRTGTLALSEKPLINAALLAIDEINQSGGVKGRQLKAVVRNGASDPAVFGAEAERLIIRDHVSAIFGCWTSASRKAVKEVVEKYRSLLWYPVQYEGLEQSPNIIYTGQCLNQQIEPAVQWALSNGKRKFLLIGSGYIFPRVANDLIRAIVEENHGEILDEIYLPLGSRHVGKIVAKIAKLHPDIIFNTINGDTNVILFRQMAASGLKPEASPVISCSFSEVELQKVAREAAGHYACWSYFSGLDSQDNLAFKQALRKKYGEDHPVSEPIVNAYTQVHLWRRIVEAIGTDEPAEVARRAIGHRITGPAGEMVILANRHVRKYACIGQADSSGNFDIVWRSEGLIDPEPWLGIENVPILRKSLIKKGLGLYPNYVYLSYELEKQIIRNRQAESELKQTETKLQELYKNERVLREKLEDEIKKRIRYTHALVHELRTPLTPVITSGEMLVDILTEGPADRLAKNIYQGAIELNRRIEELLELARIEVGTFKLVFQPVNFLKLVGDTVEHMTPMAAKNQQTLSCVLPESLPVIKADSDRLSQALMNLITNAVKHSTGGSRIEVRVKKNDGHFLVEVADNGRGISEELQKRLFEPYFQIETDRGSLSGLGLGLAITKKIVELHDGQIWVKSKPGEGSTFSFSIPIKEVD